MVVLTHMRPARRSLETVIALSRSLVHKELASPNSVSFASSTASSVEANLVMLKTGPNISSRKIAMVRPTRSKAVGAKKAPPHSRSDPGGAQDGTEYRLPEDRHGPADPIEDRGSNESPPLISRWLVSAGQEARPRFLAPPDTPQHLLRAFLMEERPDVRTLVHGVADPKGARPLHQPLHKLVGHRILDEQARSGDAALALVEVDAEEHAVQGVLEVRVGEHDVGGLASQLQRELLDVAGRCRHHFPADGG